MKNIHVLPTPNPSRLLYFGTSKELTLQINPATFRAFERSPQNIYITNSEEIKINDYITDGYKVWKWKDNSSLLSRKKVILTTDQDLIADGIQAIDDEFLEWFVKNPSCEKVNIEKIDTFKKTNEVYLDEITGGNYYEIIKKYKIIIPSEECKVYTEGEYIVFEFPKEKPTLTNIRCTCMNFEPNCFTGSCRKCGFPPKEEPKQETIEEAAERLYPIRETDDYMDMYDKNFDIRNSFIAGAKWQQENSEEDLREAFNVGRLYQGREGDTTFNQWFEQFKKK